MREWVLWVLCWKNAPHIRKYINRDAARLIVQYIRTGTVYCHRCDDLLDEEGVFCCELCWDTYCKEHMFLEAQGPDPRAYCDDCGELLAENGYFSDNESVF